MMRIIFVALLFVTSILAYSQQIDSSKKKIIIYGITAGINYSKFKKDSFNYKAEPVVGFLGKYKLSDKIRLKGVALFARKGATSSTSYIKLQNSYIELNLISQFRIVTDLFIHTGLSYSYLLASKKIVYDGDKWNGATKANINGYYSEVNFLAGVELKLQKKWSIELCYYIPCSKNNIQNFKLSLNYYFSNKISKSVNSRRINRDLSKVQINNLKQGTLLVRMNNSEKAINSLLSEGKNQREEENKQIIMAFKEKFLFSKVAFFNSKDSEKIVKRKFENLFLNENLEIENSIIIDSTKSIFIAEFGALTRDSVNYLTHYGYEQNKPLSKRIIKENDLSSFGKELITLIIKDNKFNQLNSPFPYYTRNKDYSFNNNTEQIKIDSASIQLSLNKTVERMNLKLFKFYKKNK